MGVLFAIALERYEVRGMAGSGLFFFFMDVLIF
jgi:hypothetical protein